MTQTTDERGILAPGVEYFNNRAEFLAKTGTQAPPFRAGEPIKRWRIMGRPVGDIYTAYKFLNRDASGHPFIDSNGNVSIGGAGLLNLPGAYGFPKYADWLKPANSFRLFDFAGTTHRYPIDPELLMTQADAESLAIEIASQSGTGAVAVEEIGAHEYSDLRKVFNIRVGDGSRYAAGILFKARSITNGIGSPGLWTVPVNGSPVWTPATTVTGEAETRVIPVPVRELLPGERLQVNLANQIVVVSGEEAAPTSGGGFTAADREMLAALHARIVTGR